MNELIEEKLAEVEAEWEQPLYERLLKVAVIGLASVVFTWLAENQYDLQYNRLKERKRDARSRTQV